jgi:hypothetical protein
MKQIETVEYTNENWDAPVIKNWADEPEVITSPVQEGALSPAAATDEWSNQVLKLLNIKFKKDRNC